MPVLLKDRIKSLFRKRSLPSITEASSLEEVMVSYPHFEAFMSSKYGIALKPSEKQLSLKEFVTRHGLPPAQVLFMEVQLENLSTQKIEQLSAVDAKRLLQSAPELTFLDVREPWELQMGKIAPSTPLTVELMDRILTSGDKEKPVLLYCHFGIRSLDAASYLVDQGFRRVYVLKGGIDSWSTEIDPSIPRYEGAYC